MRAHETLVEQAEQDAAELAVAVLLVMFEGEGAGDHFAPGVGLAFRFLRLRFESFDLSVDLVAPVPQELEPVSRRMSRHLLFS